MILTSTISSVNIRWSLLWCAWSGGRQVFLLGGCLSSLLFSSLTLNSGDLHWTFNLVWFSFWDIVDATDFELIVDFSKSYVFWKKFKH